MYSAFVPFAAKSITQSTAWAEQRGLTAITYTIIFRGFGLHVRTYRPMQMLCFILEKGYIDMIHHLENFTDSIESLTTYKSLIKIITH